MTTTWLLNAVGLYATTVGALLIWTQLLSSRRYADDMRTTDTKHTYMMDLQKLAIAVGLLCLWFVAQDLGVLLL
jgi:hypothetical protein